MKVDGLVILDILFVQDIKFRQAVFDPLRSSQFVFFSQRQPVFAGLVVEVGFEMLKRQHCVLELGHGLLLQIAGQFKAQDQVLVILLGMVSFHNWCVVG